MLVDDFDYELPQELIAQYPAAERDISRLLVLDKATGRITHSNFRKIADYLREGDLLVFNETKVFPARLKGQLVRTGSSLEVLLLEEKGCCSWEALVRPGKRAKEGEIIAFGDGLLQAVICERTEAGGRIIKFNSKDQTEFWNHVFKIGEVPLPP